MSHTSVPFIFAGMPVRVVFSPTTEDIVSLGTDPTFEAAIKTKSKQLSRANEALSDHHRRHPASSYTGKRYTDMRAQIEKRLATVKSELELLKQANEDFKAWTKSKAVPTRSASPSSKIPAQPRPSDMPRMPSRKKLESIRSQIHPDLWVKLEDEIEAFRDDCKSLRDIDDWSDEDTRESIISIAIDWIEDGGPATIKPCPQCKDANGLSRGHDGSHEFWPYTCQRCKGYGYTGFANPFVVTEESQPQQAALAGLS